MKGIEAITDEEWAMILSAQKDITAYLIRVSRMPEDTVQDCVQEAVIEIAVEFDPVAVSTAANAAMIERHTQIYLMLRGAANKRLGAARRYSAKHISDDTPIGEEDGDMKLGDLFVPRSNSAERVENYAEWKMFSRRGGCPLAPEEIDDLFGMYKTDVK